MYKCDFCGKESDDLVEEAFWSPITRHESTRLGCRDKRACLERQADRVREWEQSLGKREVFKTK